MSIAINILSLLGIGGIIGYLIKYFLDYKYSKKVEQLNKKRIVYEELVETLNVFVSGREVSIEKKEKFLGCYSSIWLWAPDIIVKKVGIFLEHIVFVDKNTESGQREGKKLFGEIIIEMRKDIGFSNTTLSFEDFKFVSFK